MTSKLKVNIIADGGDNAIMTSNGSGTLTLNNAALKNSPAFFVNKTSNQTLSNATDTKITFDTEVFDTDNAFASDKFTVPTGKDGKYFIATNLFTDAGAVSNYQYANIEIYKNGARASYHIHDIRNNAGHQISLTSTLLMDLSASDYVEIYCRIADLSGSPHIDVNGTDFFSYFYGYKLIGA